MLYQNQTKKMIKIKKMIKKIVKEKYMKKQDILKHGMTYMELEW